MKSFPKRLLLSNRAWVANRLNLRSMYFKRLAKGQSPQALWIGCSDSRVPAEEITGARPGDLFVTRNIANVVPANDPGMESILYYSLAVLKVKHIIICGHTGCGGVLAAIQGVDQPDLEQWLKPVRAEVPASTVKPTGKELTALSYDVVKKNVTRGLGYLSEHSLVMQARDQGTLKSLHGWVYDLQTGLIESICERKFEGEKTEISDEPSKIQVLG